MKISACDTPVVVLGCGLGALAIIRSLGGLGVPVYSVIENNTAHARMSKYCTAFYRYYFDESCPEAFLEKLNSIDVSGNQKPLLIPTTDELAVFVAEYSAELGACFNFPHNDPDLVRTFSSKKSLYRLAQKHGINTPATFFPDNLEDLTVLLDSLEFPVLVKGILGNRLLSDTGFKMLLVSSEEELLTLYERLPFSAQKNIMLQEHIPGDDDQVYIFNGYFNADSHCLAGYTGFKIRQSPIHFGSASLGECRLVPEVADLTIGLLQKVGYRGIIDIGYRLDPRDKEYKVLDINPRVGQAFRLFVAENGLDVIRAFYLDMTGQDVPVSRPIEGRRWLIENNDMISCWHYFKEGSLDLGSWLRSFRGVQEAAWFCLKDPAPFVSMAWRLLKRACRWGLKRRRLTDSEKLFGRSETG